MTARLGLVVFALLLASSGSAQDAGAPADVPDFRLEGRPALMFNQHLYFGSFDRPRALAFDAAHREIWMADAGSGRVAVFRPDGSELFSFASRQHVRDPARIAVTPEGDVAIVEGKRAQVRLFNYRGEYKGDVPLPDADHARVIGAICYDGDGNLYVGDNATAEIFVYAPDGRVRFRFGSRGSDEGQFEAISAITVGADGRIYVADARAIAVQVFDRQGNFIRGWGKHESGSGNFSLPSGIAVDAKQRVFVCDELRHQVTVFSSDGTLLGGFGGLGNGMGQLSFPTDLVLDDTGRIYVAERLTGRVQVFELVTVPIARE